MFRSDQAGGWTIGRWMMAGAALTLVFLGAMMLMWGIGLFLRGDGGTGILLGTLGSILTFTGGQLARGPLHAHPHRGTQHTH